MFRPLSETTVANQGYQLYVSFPKDAYLWSSAIKHMLRGDEVRRSVPDLLDEIERKVTVHNRWVNEAVALGALIGVPELDLDEVPEALRAVDESAESIGTDVEKVRSAFRSWSKAIEVGQYYGIVPKADCCPTVLSIMKQYWLG